GAYRMEIEVRQAATAQDRQRIAAERSLAEAGQLGGEAAIEKLRSALAQWRELGDSYWQMVTLDSLAGETRRLSRYQDAIELGEQELQISRRMADRIGEANALTGIGMNNSMMGRQEEAIVYFERALTIRREAKLREEEAASLSHLGTANNLLGRYDRAIEY